MTLEGSLLALAILVLRIINYSVGTLRLVAIGRGLKLFAAVLAAFEGLIFAVVIAGVVQDLENILNLTAYCLGASLGSWAGMELEARLVKSYVIANIFSAEKGRTIAERLREAGYGVTETIGEGRDGIVITLRSVINKREMTSFTRLVNEINPDAFIAVEEARGVRHGWLGTGRGKTL
jgi:uncharacterized protein YebE (UPF0316 family)